MMFVPGHNNKLMHKSLESNADALILDLEDSVQPLSNKAMARETILHFAAEGMYEHRHVFPRVNDRDSGLLLEDISRLTVHSIDGFVIPKVCNAKDIVFVDLLLETLEYQKRFEIGTFKLVPLIETAAAVMNAMKICKASMRVIALAFGCEDFVADIEGSHGNHTPSRVLTTPRALIALACRANGVIPIDTVHIDVHDLADLKFSLALAKELGFEGMLVLHPKELDLVHQYFTPGDQEIEDAQEMIRLYEEAQKNNKGVAVVNGKFIGPPFVVAAKKLLSRKELIERG